MSTFTFERRLDARLIIAVVATGLMSFTGICVETAMNVVFPTLMREFNIPTSTVQWVTTIYLCHHYSRILLVKETFYDTNFIWCIFGTFYRGDVVWTVVSKFCGIDVGACLTGCRYRDYLANDV